MNTWCHSVYFFAYEGKIKVGYSAKVRQRLAAHRRQYLGLELIGIISGNRKRERSLHQQFKDFNAHGEWFFDKPELRAAIQKIVNEEKMLPVDEPPPQQVTRPDFLMEERERLRRGAAFRAPFDEHKAFLAGHAAQLKALSRELKILVEAANDDVFVHFVRSAEKIGRDDPGQKPDAVLPSLAAIRRSQLLIENLITCAAVMRRGGAN